MNHCLQSTLIIIVLVDFLTVKRIQCYDIILIIKYTLMEQQNTCSGSVVNNLTQSLNKVTGQ